MFFDNLEFVWRIAVLAVLTYAALVAMVRFSGKRTLAQLNAFDFLVTVAIGSALANAILARETPLAEGVAALAMLILLQYVVALLSTRLPFFNKLVKSQPRLLFSQGEFLKEAMLHERVTKEELLEVLRSHGIGDLNDVEALVLETNGTFSVVKKTQRKGAMEALSNVR